MKSSVPTFVALVVVVVCEPEKRLVFSQTGSRRSERKTPIASSLGLLLLLLLQLRITIRRRRICQCLLGQDIGAALPPHYANQY